MFIYGWNHYLWPFMIATNQDMYPISIRIKTLIAGGDSAVEWNMVMAMPSPALVVIVIQR